MVTATATKTLITVRRQDGSEVSIEAPNWERETICKSCGRSLAQPLLVIRDADNNVVAEFQEWADFRVESR